MKKPDYQIPGPDKQEYHIITPEGKEVLFGYFRTEGAAQGLWKRRYPADWRGLATMLQSDVKLS